MLLFLGVVDRGGKPQKYRQQSGGGMAPVFRDIV